MNAEYTPFEEWYETFERDGGELMLYNTIDLEATYLAGAAAMREKCAEVAENETRPVGEHMRNFNDEGYNDACEDIAAAIRKLEVHGEWGYAPLRDKAHKPPRIS